MVKAGAGKKSVKTIAIAGGGTGGHIYPGVAIARALSVRGCIVHWVGAKGGLEEKIVPREGLPLHLIAIGKLHSSVGFWSRIKTVCGLPIAFLQAVRLVLRLKPDSVLGVGGFASGPFLFVAALLGRRTLIWEPNAHAGLANRILAPFVDECLIVFPEADSSLRNQRVTRVGLPVRSSIRPQARPDLAGRKIRVLVFGGSQGARAVNRVVQAAVMAGGPWLDQVELLHQTGRADFAELSHAYKALGHSAVVCVEYIDDMGARYQWADVVVCRAGASTVAEIAAAGKAAIFVPLPTAADDHQLKNARALERAGGARVIEQKDFTVNRLTSALLELKNDPRLLAELEKRALGFATPGAAEMIADRVEN